MADGESQLPTSGGYRHHRDSIKSPAHNIASRNRRQQAVTIGKERREALIRAKRLCRDPIAGYADFSVEGTMSVDEEETMSATMSELVEKLKSALSYQGKGAAQMKLEALHTLRRLLSKSEFPPIEAAIQAGAIPLLVQCLSFGSSNEQILEAAWCLTNVAASGAEETKSLVPALPLLIAHLGEKSSPLVAEQCAWAIGNVAGEGEELRNILLAQGALLPLSRLISSPKGSTARTAAWALSNLMKGPSPKAANELIQVGGLLDVISRHLEKADDELATEISWVVVYLSALSEKAISQIVKSSILHLLIERLAVSQSLQLLIPVLRCIGNLVAADSYVTSSILVAGQNITNQLLMGLIKCLKIEHRVLRKESSWVLSNMAAGSYEHKVMIYSSEITPLLMQLVAAAPFDIRREAAYALGNLCVLPANGTEQSSIIVDHLVAIVSGGCLPAFISLIRSADIESARLGLQFLELVMRGYPNGEGPRLVEAEDGIEAMERFQFHENEEIRNMANGLVDKYFGEDYGLEDEHTF